MYKKIITILTALVILDIIDGDFMELSILDGIKAALYIICFVLLILNKKKER